MKLIALNLLEFFDEDIEKTAFNPDDLMRDIDTRTKFKSGPCVSSLTAFDNQTYTATFSTVCIERNWMQTVVFADAAQLQVASSNKFAQEKENPEVGVPIPEGQPAQIIEPKLPKLEIKTLDDLKNQHPEIYKGNIYAGCNCPAFAYFYAYIISQLDTNLRNYYEGRFPIIRNPQLQGTVCKHLVSVFRTFFV